MVLVSHKNSKFLFQTFALLAIFNSTIAYNLYKDFPEMCDMLMLIKKRGRGQHAMNIQIKMIHQAKHGFRC